MYEDFLFFLINNGAHHYFVKNWNEQNIYGITFEEYIQRYKVLPKNYMSSSFVWSFSYQGLLYWSNLSKKWEKECNKDKTNKFKLFLNVIKRMFVK